MSEVATATAAVALFGDPGGDVWGVLVGGEEPQIALAPVDLRGPGNPGELQASFAAVTFDPDDGDVWSISGDGIDLKVELAGASTHTFEDGSALQMCRLSGTGRLGSDTLEVDLPGVLLPELPDGKIDSIRIIGSWFPAGHEISLLSVRPQNAKGHDNDLVDVLARGEEQKLVFDPRVSTTYGPDGTPRKGGIELWLGDDEDGDQIPRRVAGVASGSVANSRTAGYSLEAHALHCLSRGEEGAGVYVLMRSL